MNLLLLDAHEVDAAGDVRLADRRADHLRTVLGVVPGQTLRAGIVGGALAVATVVAVDAEAVRLRVVPAADAAPPPPEVDLVVALPRPQVLHRVLQFAAAMGVRRLDLVRAWRVEKSYFSSPSLAPATLDRHLRLGAEQGMTTWLPAIGVHPRLLPFIASLAARRDAPCRLLGHPGADLGLQDLPPPARAAGTGTVVAIGPEGGWIDRELDTFQQAGFTLVDLGPWVLRVEAAVVSALSQLALLRRLPPPTAC